MKNTESRTTVEERERELRAIIHHLFYLEAEAREFGLSFAAHLIAAAAEDVTDELMGGVPFESDAVRQGEKPYLPH